MNCASRRPTTGAHRGPQGQGPRDVRENPRGFVLVLEENSWVELVDVDLGDAVIGEAMLYFRMGGDQRAMRGMGAAESVNGPVDAGECRDGHVVDLSEPSTFELRAPSDDACTRSTTVHVAKDEAAVDGFELHTSSWMVDFEREELEFFVKGVVVWMGGDVDLMHNGSGDVVVFHGLVVLR